MSFTTTVKEVITNDKSGLLTKHPSWERVLLSDIATILNGAPFDSAMFNTGDGFPLIRIRDLLTGATNTYYTGDYDETYVVNKDDLLIGMDGDFNSAFWNSAPALLNQRVCKITPDETWYSQKLLGFLLPGYLAAINQHTSAITVKHLSSKTIGEIELPLPPRAEQTRIVEKLEELFSDLDAGIAELKAAQKKLAQYRQSLLKAAVEGALTAEWRANRKSVHALRQSSGQASTSSARTDLLVSTAVGESVASIHAVSAPAVRPELVEGPSSVRAELVEAPSSSAHPSTSSGRADDEGAGAQLLERILKERRARWEAKQLAKFQEQGKTPPKDWKAKYPEPVKPDTSNLPELPEGWVWATIDQIGEVLLGKMLDKEKHQSGVKIKYLRNINIRWGRIDSNDLLEMYFEEDEFERFSLVVGDVLVCEGGEPGRAAVCSKEHENFKYQKALHRVRLFGCYSPELLVFLLENYAQSGRLEQSFTGSTIKHFTKESFIALAIPLPPILEQLEVVQQMALAIESSRHQLLAIDYSLKQSTAQRKNILKAAFSGQLVPQDPNDEPASVLLERIRAERAKEGKKLKSRKAKGMA